MFCPTLKNRVGSQPSSKAPCPARKTSSSCTHEKDEEARLAPRYSGRLLYRRPNARKPARAPALHGRRLLLIAQPQTHDAVQADVYDMLIGYWHKNKRAFVAADSLATPETGQTLRVYKWAELAIHNGVQSVAEGKPARWGLAP
jgi:hypothetical protein